MFSSDPELPIGDLPNPPLLPTSCEPHCDGLESMRLPGERTCSGMRWLPGCSATERLCPRSAKSWATSCRRPQQSTPKSIRPRYGLSPSLGREVRHERVAESSLGAGRLISAQLYGVSKWDPLALTLASSALAVCAFFAAMIPASRALVRICACPACECSGCHGSA